MVGAVETAQGRRSGSSVRGHHCSTVSSGAASGPGQLRGPHRRAAGGKGAPSKAHAGRTLLLLPGRGGLGTQGLSPSTAAAAPPHPVQTHFPRHLHRPGRE